MISKFEKYLDESFNGLVKKGEVTFWVWFILIFLGTVIILSALGLLPSELKENSAGNSFIESGSQQIDDLLGGQGEQGAQSGQPNSGAGETISGTEGTPFSEFPTQAKTNGTGAMPTTIGQQGGSSTQGSNTQANGYGILPTRLTIPSIGVNTVIINPTSTSTAKLDYELTKGPVRYPGSGTIGSGNMFIFGHSTGWSVVQNKAYKVFNSIKTLNNGDLIYVQSGNTTYTYKVRLVTEVNKNDTLITFDTTVNMLTLSTCDSFGAKTDRFVVTADFVGAR